MNKKSLVAIALLTVSALSSAQSVYPGQHLGKMKKETVAPVRVQSFDLKDVRLLPSRFRDNMLRDSAWMTSIDVNRCCIASVRMPESLQVVKVVI